MSVSSPFAPVSRASLSKGERTKAVILDAAELLFSDLGYDAVSVRMIAEAAGVPFGLVPYHFQTKDVIFEEVVARRSGRLTELRRQAMKEMPDPYRLEDVLRAFIRPYLDQMLAGDPGWRAYAKLSAHLAQNARWTPLVLKYFGSFGLETLARIRNCEPRLSKDAAARGYVFMISVVMGVFAGSKLIDHFSEGDLRGDDLAAAVDPVVTFVASGIRGLSE